MRPARPRTALPAAFSAILALALGAAPAWGQQGARAPGKTGADKTGADRTGTDKAGPDKPGAPPVIGCPSLANYRLLMRAGAPAAAALLADPKADHLGCAPLPRGRITGVAERVTLGARTYACASVQGTTACHWMEDGITPSAAVRPAR